MTMDSFFKMTAIRFSLLLFVMSSLFYRPANSGSVQLMQSNINDILSGHEFVFVNFYADWCRFSQILGPVFDEAATKVAQDFPGQGKVAFGKVDCDKETDIASQYHVSKYPTLKLFRFGQLVKREYRGQRSPEALSNFVKEQLKTPISAISNSDELKQLDRKKRHMIGYFESESSPQIHAFHKLASIMRDDCVFHGVYGELSATERQGGDKIVFRPPQDDAQDDPFHGDVNNYDVLHSWAVEKCVPLVREITFENAEELTEEGLPFLILFHNPDDKDIVQRFNKIVASELVSEKNGINMLLADGNKFSHPLHHLGKTTNDLPILAIDSFRHMYLWTHNTATDIDKPGMVKQFITDLHSGKLHREFHHGPDATTTTAAPPPPVDDGTPHEEKPKALPKQTDDEEKTNEPPRDPTQPPESTFAKLAPSRQRYTLLRDEL